MATLVAVLAFALPTTVACPAHGVRVTFDPARATLEVYSDARLLLRATPTTRVLASTCRRLPSVSLDRYAVRTETPRPTSLHCITPSGRVFFAFQRVRRGSFVDVGASVGDVSAEAELKPRAAVLRYSDVSCIPT